MNAVVLQLPPKVRRAAARRLNRIDVEARYRWARKHSDKWETTEVDGAEAEPYLNPRCRQLMELLDKEWGVIKGPTMKAMCRYVDDSRRRVEKRNQVKAWLQSHGADLDEITTPEQALFFVFDHMHSRGLLRFA